MGAGHNMWPINYWGLASISTSYASASLECRVEFGRPDIIFAANFGVPLHSKAICCYFGRIVGVAVNDLRLSNSHAKQSWFRNEVWAGAANLPLDFTSYSQNQCVAIPNHSPNCTKLAVVGVCTKQSHPLHGHWRNIICRAWIWCTQTHKHTASIMFHLKFRG